MGLAMIPQWVRSLDHSGAYKGLGGDLLRGACKYNTREGEINAGLGEDAASLIPVVIARFSLLIRLV